MVAALWQEAIDAPPEQRVDVSARAERLLARVSSENPPVNWGLTSLYLLSRESGTSRYELEHARDGWLAEMKGYEADPVGWLRRYYRDMVIGFAEEHGAARARSFAAKLVDEGCLPNGDLPPQLRN